MRQSTKVPCDASSQLISLNRLVNLQLPFSLDFHIASARSLIAHALRALPRAQLVFVNVAEFGLLERLITPRRLEAVVVTDGPREARFLRCGEPVARITPQATKVSDVTNAGDVLAGCFLAWHAFGLDDATALGRAVSAATKSVRDPPWLLVPR
jgi:sugar/nucleoside kinase (ribokinase family)